jgi:hypothetical protein
VPTRRRRVTVNDMMQRGYAYALVEPDAGSFIAFLVRA